MSVVHESIYGTICLILAVGLLSIFYFTLKKDKEQFWHHAVRLPSRMRQPYWYLVSISTGCRPWAGHEGDIFLRLVGTRAESRTFIVNGEIHSRLWEADSHLYLYSSSWPLGEINYVIVACRSATRKKRWYLSSIQIKYVTPDPEKEKNWYFPYHEWVEVFHDPLKVTLCSVDPNHDLNRRLMLGWLGRCLSVINGLVPQLGAVVLGLFGSSCAMVPVSGLEAILRRVEWRRKILLEEVKWYKAADEGDYSIIGRPRTYRQFILKPTHKKMNYELMFYDEEKGLNLNSKTYKEILEDDDKFWHWLDPSIDLPPPVESKLSLDNAEETANENAPEEAVDDEDEDYDENEEDETLFEKYFSKLKNFFATIYGETPDEEAAESENPLDDFVKPKTTQDQEGMIQAIDATGEMATAGNDEDVESYGSSVNADSANEKKPIPKTILYVGDGYLVHPMSVWQVDSDFSIDSLDMEGTNLDEFTHLESMPAAEFVGFKKRKNESPPGFDFTSSELAIMDKYNSGRRGAISQIRETVSRVGEPWGHDCDTKTSEIKIPHKLELLTAEETKLVSWVFFDRCVHGNKWLKKDAPLASVLLSNEDDGGYRAIDWTGVDVSSDGEEETKPRKYADAFRSEDLYQRSEAIRQLRRLYPEPVPRERIFSMLMMPDYISKFSKAYDEMVKDPEAWSALADLYAEWAECDEGPVLFCEACINVSKLPMGGKIVRDIIACGRTSVTWTALVCELTQRLRYQGDNVERLKEKYGFDDECLINATEKECCDSNSGPRVLKMPQSAFNIAKSESLLSALNPCPKPSLACVYTELQKLSEWRKKLSELESASNKCPMNDLSHDESRKMSRFYRSMLMSSGGCALFGELLRQVTISNDRGRRMVCRLICYVAGQSDGVPYLNHLLKGLGQTDHSGRSILTRIYVLVENRKPNGPRVISKLANALESVEMGRFLLKDFQIDAGRAHRRAHEVRQTIRRKIDPLVKISRKNICCLVTSMNEIVRFMLGVADNARAVLEGSDKSISEIPENKETAIVDNAQPVNDHTWLSERNCCQNYLDLQKQVHDSAQLEKKIERKEPEYFQLTDSNSEVPFITRQSFLRKTASPRLVSELWKPIDGRGDVIDIYHQNKEEQPTIKLPESTDEGFISPCKPKHYCETQKRMNQNEFFLQSKDYERFNIDFKPNLVMRDLERNYHHDEYDPDKEISRCWKQPISTRRRDAYVGLQNLPTDEKEACVKWGKDFNPENAKNWGGISLCTCHHLGDDANGHHCLICSMANKMEKAETSDQVVDVLTTECDDLPVKPISDLKSVPIVNKVTVKNIHQILEKKLARKKGKDLMTKSDINEDNLSKKSSILNIAPMPSGQKPILTDQNGLSTAAYPNCGTRVEKVCQCVGGDKRIRNVHLAHRYLGMFGNYKTDDAVSMDNTTDNNEHQCNDGTEKIIAPDSIKPDTALRRRQERKDVKFTSNVPSEFFQHRTKQIPTNTEEYKFPVTIKTSSEEIAFLSKKNDTEYWGREDSDVSVFSQPTVASPSIHCDICGGLLVPKFDENSQIYNYLQQNGQRNRQKDAETLDSSNKDLSLSNSQISLNDSADRESWKSAMGCCNTPGCYSLNPRNTRFRNEQKNNELSLKNAEIEMREEIQERYKQWIKETPCKNVFCPKVKESTLQSEEELSDASTMKYSDDIKLIDSFGNLTKPLDKSPITARYKKVKTKEKFLEDVCEICKFPKFKCCDVNDSDDSGKVKRIGGRHCLCKQVDSLQNFYTVPSTPSRESHSVCSECHVRLGTQQSPPCTRYLLPLKIVRCYENTLRKYRKVPPVSSDSGLSMDTALDMHNESDLTPPNENEQMTILDLMGLSGRPGVKRRRRRCLPREGGSSKDSSGLENCSVCSSTSSSGVCCHVHSSRLLPVMHLQGFVCQESDQYLDIHNPSPLSFQWWKKHANALHAMQSCADACVGLCIVLAKNKTGALTDHEKSCKVCTFTGASRFEILFRGSRSTGHSLAPRYSEFLPNIWKSQIQTFGQCGERSSIFETRRARFYIHLISAIVESTRMLLLTPDLKPECIITSKSLYERLLLGTTQDEQHSSSSEDSVIEEALKKGEAQITTTNVGRLAHFRSMMKGLNDIQDEGSKIRKTDFVSDHDVTRITLLQQERDETAEDKENRSNQSSDNFDKTTEEKPPSLIDLLINFMKKKACGSVLDCRELLEDPWELPADQQQIAARMLRKIDSAISGITESSCQAVDKLTLWESSLACLTDAFLNEVCFRAMAQKNILDAIKQSNSAIKFMTKLSDNSRLCIARLVRFTELTQAATSNLKEAIKEGLADVDHTHKNMNEKQREEMTSISSSQWKSKEDLDAKNQYVKSHIAALLRTGRDDRRATLDDVLISFERMRGNLLYDLRDAAEIIKNISDLGDDSVLWLRNVVNKQCLSDENNKDNIPPCWTESNLKQNEENAKSPDIQSDKEVDEIHSDKCSSTLIPNKPESDIKINDNLKPATSADMDPVKNEEDTSTTVTGINPSQSGLHSVTKSSIGFLSSDSASNTKETTDNRSFAIGATQIANKTPVISNFNNTSEMSSTPRASIQKNKMESDNYDVKTKIKEELIGELVSEANVETEENLPFKFQSVFKLTSLTDFKHERHARKALRADKGKGMLQCIFGNEMTELEMIEAFHGNIRTLISWRNSCFPNWIGVLAQVLLLLLAIGSFIGACILPFYMESVNYVLLSAIPVAIFGHGFVLEPLKCLIITWILFVWRHKPAFYNNPMYMKSSLPLLQRARLSHPRFSDDFKAITEEPHEPCVEPDDGDEYYYKFCDNRASTNLFDRRRRKLPVLTEHDFSLDLQAVISYDALSGEVEVEAIPEPPPEPVVSTHTSEFLSVENESISYGGHRRGGVDNGGHRSASPSIISSIIAESNPRKDSDIVATSSSETQSNSTEIVEEEKPRHTPIIYCRYSNIPT